MATHTFYTFDRVMGSMDELKWTPDIFVQYHSDSTFPFQCLGSAWKYIRPFTSSDISEYCQIGKESDKITKELSDTYLLKQTKFIEETELKIGSVVRVVKKCPSKDKGWADSWVDDMDYAITQNAIVKSVDPSPSGIELMYTDSEGNYYSYYFPYHVLEIVKA